MKDIIKILMIDDDQFDIDMTFEIFNQIRTGKYQFDSVNTYDDGVKQILKDEHDLYLVDLNLESYNPKNESGKTKNGVLLVQEAIDNNCIKPFILLTSVDSFIVDLQAMKVGASDYLIKQTITPDILEHAVRYAIKEKQVENELIASNDVKDKVFSVINKDLRSSLGTLISSLEFLNDSNNNIDQKTFKTFINDIYKSSQITWELLENLLYWSSCQLGDFKVNKQPILLNDVVKNTMGLLKIQASKKNIDISTECPRDLLLNVDVTIANFLLRNIISNAIKFTPEDGKIIVDCFVNDDVTGITVQDNGIGMDNETIEKILNPAAFYSVSGTNSEVGSGLGLKVCKEFIELHGGKLFVESQIGEGSTFTFTIPMI